MTAAPDFTTLLNKIVPEENEEAPVRLRKAVVSALNSDGTVDLTLSGATVPGVSRLSGAAFAVGDNVQVLVYRGSMLVLGTVAATQGGDNPNFWALVGTPSIANNTVSALTPTSWPLNEGGLYPGSGTTLTIPSGQGGVYDIGIYLRYASQASSAGVRQARINAYGGDHAIFNMPAVTNYNASNITVGGVKRSYLAAGATIVFEAYQNSGGALSLATADNCVWLQRVG